MVLEEEIPAFGVWLGPALVWYLFTAALVAVVAAAGVWLVQSILCGPLAAGDRVYRGLLSGLADLAGVSGRRVWALTRLAVQESLRRNVLVVLGLFAVIVLFAGWFLDPASVNPGRLYLGFILAATNLLVCLVTLVLSVFSLPADIKAKAIQTVTTKPVRTAEIVLGRFLGFALVGSALLAVMGVAGWAFVVRSVGHGHVVAADDDEFGSVRSLEGHRRGVRFAALLGRIGGPDRFPHVLPGLGIDAEDERVALGIAVEARIVGRHLLALEHREVKASIQQQGARPVDPHQPEAAEVLADIP